MKERAIYKRFKTAVEGQGLSAEAVEAMTVDEVRAMADAAGATATFLENMQRRVAGRLRKIRRAEIAAWIESKVRDRFASAAVRMRDGNIAVMRLDGEEGK